MGEFCSATWGWGKVPLKNIFPLLERKDHTSLTLYTYIPLDKIGDWEEAIAYNESQKVSWKFYLKSETECIFIPRS